MIIYSLLCYLHDCTFRSSHQRCSIKKGVLRNFTKFTGKNLRWSLFSNKVAGLRPANLLKKRLCRRCFLVNFVKFLRTPLLQDTSKRLLVTVFINLHEKSHQHCPLIYHLSCNHHSRRKKRRILRIWTFVRISWICKNWKNFAKYFLLVCYGLLVLSTARISVENNLIFTYLVTFQKICPVPGTFSNFSQVLSFPFFRWHALQFCNI